MFKSKSKGFTIIELLVVVAIIAVLAAIVLFNVTAYINKGKNAAIKGNLSSALTSSAVFYDTNGNYTGYCTNSGYTNPSSAITAAGGTAQACNVTVTTGAAWCAIATELQVGGVTNKFCVDSTGAKIESTTVTCTSTNNACQ